MIRISLNEEEKTALIRLRLRLVAPMRRRLFHHKHIADDFSSKKILFRCLPQKGWATQDDVPVEELRF